MMHRLLVCLNLLVCFSAAAADATWDIGDRKQLFIDRRFIAAGEGIELKMNQAQKLGLIRDENGKSIFAHVSRVIEDQGKIRLYVGHDGVAIFESDDGLHFRATGKSIGGGEFLDDLFGPARSRSGPAIQAVSAQKPANLRPRDRRRLRVTSADGLHFTEVGRVLPCFTDNPTIVLWDERIGKYVIYLRALAYDSQTSAASRGSRSTTRSSPGRFASRTIRDRSEHRERAGRAGGGRRGRSGFGHLLQRGHDLPLGARRVPDVHDPVSPLLAPAASVCAPAAPGQWEDFGPLEVQLAVSRDGIHWQRPSREPYFPTGLADEWDRWYAVMGPGLVRRGNYLYQYYNSSGRLHDGAILRAEYEKSAPQLGGIGIVRQRLDGFVSADVDHKGGWLQTPLLTFRGNRLRLNIDTGAMGTAFVELRDADGQPIPGFTLADCEEIGGNFIDQLVYWKGNPDVSSLAGREIRLHVRLKRGKLYAFQFRQE